MNRIAAAILLAVLTTACSTAPGGGDVDVPRRRAYFRLQLPEAVYRDVAVGDATVRLNGNAAVEASRPGWVTAVYPHGLAEIYITDTPLQEGSDEAIANRMERLAMNTGGAVTRTDCYINAGGYDCTLLVTPAGSPTPVQFLAIAPGCRMLSGSAVLKDYDAAASDSLAPVVTMLERDVKMLLDSLL